MKRLTSIETNDVVQINRKKIKSITGNARIAEKSFNPQIVSRVAKTDKATGERFFFLSGLGNWLISEKTLDLLHKAGEQKPQTNKPTAKPAAPKPAAKATPTKKADCKCEDKKSSSTTGKDSDFKEAWSLSRMWKAGGKFPKLTLKEIFPKALKVVQQ